MRAGEIEATLKRLSRLADKLMQLARAEGGRPLADTPADLRPILSLVASDFTRAGAGARFALTLPGTPVPSRIDPDAFAILCRNLIENALRHGGPDEPVEVALTEDGLLRVQNGGPPVPADVLPRLTRRFERAAGAGEGSGLGPRSCAPSSSGWAPRSISPRRARAGATASPRPCAFPPDRRDPAAGGAAFALPLEGFRQPAARFWRKAPIFPAAATILVRSGARLLLSSGEGRRRRPCRLS